MSRPVLGVVVWLALCGPAYAQTLGTITGEVKDESGATVPGVNRSWPPWALVLDPSLVLCPMSGV